MSKTMIVNALHPEEIRIAIKDGKELTDLEVESKLGRKLKGNVYKAKVARIEPSLQAAFLDIGTQRNGFLQINDIHPSYFVKNPPKGISGNKIPIQDVLEQGQELIVQVVKEERNLKGATLTTYLSLPGRYVVLMPGSDRGGISRKIINSDQRIRLKKLSKELELPTGIGLIVRTAGLDRSMSDLTRDTANQIKLWEGVLEEAQTAETPCVLYQESDVTTRVIRDYFTPDVREILIDEKRTFQKIKTFVEEVMPRYRSRVKRYEDPEPIFASFDIDKQVAATLEAEVVLKSGGSIVIEQLEALVAIDVNSGKATGGGTIEETAFYTNLEAADEIAKQIRLRDLGGLIVIDFIDMTERRHRVEVEKRMEEAIKFDKARIEIDRLSKFGLLEMSRQRLRASLSSQSSNRCSHCQGTGRLKTNESVALDALRKIQSAVVLGNIAVVKVSVAGGPAMFLLNNKKKELVRLEKEYDVNILILPDGRLRQDGIQFEMENRKDEPIEKGSEESAQISLIEEHRDMPEEADEVIPEETKSESL